MRSEKGFTLLEVLIAMLLMGLIATGILLALATSSKTVLLANRRATAESLARSQMEDVKKQPYDAINDPPQYTTIAGVPGGFIIVFPIPVVRLNYDSNPSDDDGLQEITVRVQYDPADSSKVIELVDYKVER